MKYYQSSQKKAAGREGAPRIAPADELSAFVSAGAGRGTGAVPEAGRPYDDVHADETIQGADGRGPRASSAGKIFLPFEGLTYREYYEQYLTHTTSPAPNKCSVPIYKTLDGHHFVTLRQLGHKVCRLYWAKINRGELYFLRLLLHVPCRGFADLVKKGGDE